MERANQWLAFVANVGVIAGIVFLGYEIQQNTEQLKSDSLRDMASRMDDRILLLATDSAMAGRVMRQRSDPESLSDLDQFHLLLRVVSWIADFEEAYRQFELGAIPESALTQRSINMRRWLETPEGKRVWYATAPQADPDFVRWVESRMSHQISGWNER